MVIKNVCENWIGQTLLPQCCFRHLLHIQHYEYLKNAGTVKLTNSDACSGMEPGLKEKLRHDRVDQKWVTAVRGTNGLY